MVKLSVAIITYNEEKNIERCIRSVLEIADEIVVLDSISTDSTKDICEKYNVIFYENKFPGHIEQKNLALDKTKYDFVLSLDADEAPDKILIEEIKKIKNNFEYDGYFVNRLTNYSGHWVRYSGWYPDRKLRLFKKSMGRWTGVNPHDIITMTNSSKIKKLSGDLLHYSYPTISSHLIQTNKFTNIAAKAAFKNGVKSNLFKIISRPIFKFFRDYFYKLGILDGRYGFIICYINSLSALLKYSKIKELQEGKEIE